MTKLLTVRIMLAFFVLLISAIAAIGATFAFLSDTENSEGNTFDAGQLDLKIDNTSYYNGAKSPTTTWKLDDLSGHLFFDFHDLKPGDWGEDTISIHVINNDAFACLDSTLTSNDDVSSNEPELEVDVPEDGNNNFDGELGQNIDFIFWVDDGDNVLEADETPFAEGKANQVLGGLSTTLADSLSNLFGGQPGDPLVGEQTYYIAKAWCFGTMTQTPVPADTGVDPTVNGGITCEGSQLNNLTQSDKLTADIMFSAIQHRDNPNFTCDPVTPTSTPTNTPTPTPPIISCETADNIYASSASNNNQGKRRDGGAVLAARSVTSNMFGLPQTSGLPSDTVTPATLFFSLGFTGGNVVVGFSEPFYPNPSGADLQVFEVTGGTYPDERVKVETGPTSAGPWTVATPNPGVRDSGFEMGDTSAQFVRLTEASNLAVFPIPQFNDADGYDVDAVKAFCTQTNQ